MRDIKRIEPVYIARLIGQLKCQCISCGDCCVRSTPISLDPRDLKRLSKCFSISMKDVIKKYVRYVDGKTCIKVDRPCMFYDRIAMNCSIYKHRPNICRLFPYMANTQRDIDAFWVDSNCQAMRQFYDDYMNKNPTFLKIMELVDSNQEFARRSEITLRMLLKKKVGMSDF